VVQSKIIGVYEHSIDSYDDLFWIDEQGDGTCIYQPAQSCSTLKTTTNPVDAVIKMTNRYHYYQVGTAQLIVIGCSCSSPVIGNTRRWGAFDESDGMFFQYKDGEMSIGFRSSISGSIQEVFVPQSEWNGDKVDGLGLSMYNLDPTKAVRYWANYAYPAGVVRFGVYDGDVRIKVHEFKGSDSSYPAVRTGSMPVRYENFNEDLTSATSDLRIFSSVVIVEGDADYTFWRYGDIGCDSKPVTVNTPLVSIKSKPVLDDTGKRNIIQLYPEILSLYVTGGAAKISLCWHNSADEVLTGDTYDFDIGSSITADNTATSIDMELCDVMSNYYYCDGCINLDLRGLFELNDEGVCLLGNGVDASCLTILATKIGGDNVTVSCNLSVRELW
jgi:hypothetical protein